MSDVFIDTNGKPVIGTSNILYCDDTTGDYYKYENDSYVKVTPEEYTEVIELYEGEDGFYEESACITPVTTFNETALYIINGKGYTYIGSDTFLPVSITTKEKTVSKLNEEFKFIIPSTITKEFGGSDEDFYQYCDRIQNISQNVQSSRVALVDKPFLGRIIARICSTPYYIEPGYLPIMSVPVGTFRELDKDQRDLLFASGLIFGEDDYTLPTVTPRICIGATTAWGVSDIELRPPDALLHARRNVDHHVRNILKILASQIKRNETSVTIRYIEPEIDLYLNDELSKGTLQEYKVGVKESSYNPYTILASGNMTPVNSTLGIDFENSIKSPYTIATDYI